MTETTSIQPVDQCKYVIFLGRYKEKQFFFLTEGVFVTQLSNNVESQFYELCGLRQIAFSRAIF